MINIITNQQINVKAQAIRLIVTDVDGVLNDGSVFINDEANEPFGKFNILDGFAIKMLHDSGLQVAVISGRKSLVTEARCRKIGIKLFYTGIEDKLTQLIQISQDLEVKLSEMAYIGDDLIDLPALLRCGLKFAPANAVNEVKQRVDLVTDKFGGSGVLREVAEIILKAQGKYDKFLQQYLV